MYRNARPLELARWQFHFEAGNKQAVLRALCAYQNEDGGFGHALEPDAWNPHSSPIQTWTATQILQELGIHDHTNPIIKGIFHYLETTPDYEDGLWSAIVPSNNDFPHAPWWHYDKSSMAQWGYNPTASLAGFILNFSKPASALFQRALMISKKAIAKFIANKDTLDQHELSCFLQLIEAIESAKLGNEFDMQTFKMKMREQVSRTITRDAEAWHKGYVCRPSRFITSPESFLYEEYQELVQLEVNFLIETREKEGVWDISWDWQLYPDAFTVSKHWWQAVLALNNMLFLRNFEGLTI
jgi:hypothetical protein